MKHSLKITLFLIFIFFCAQIVGILINSQYIDVQKTAETGEVAYQELPYDFQRPKVKKTSSFIYILLGILAGTGALLLIIKFKKARLWKVWYFIAVLMCLSFALAAFLPDTAAFFLALIFAILKIFRPNIIIHNLTEIFIYGGLAAIFVPVLNIFSVIMLLALISVYDMIAVWKSKHMVKLAKFQSRSHIFAGLMIPYQKNKVIPIKKAQPAKKKKGKKVSTAVVGGGDIAFPILFSAVIMESLAAKGIPIYSAFFSVLIIVLFATAALSLLMFLSKKGRFYPAMPFISLGCLAGYGGMLLVV